MPAKELHDYDPGFNINSISQFQSSGCPLEPPNDPSNAPTTLPSIPQTSVPSMDFNSIFLLRFPGYADRLKKFRRKGA